MRQFANVSISPWANPYSGTATNPGKSFYATAVSPQPQIAYRRIVAPPAPTFSYAGVKQVVGEESDNGDHGQAGMLGRCASIANDMFG